MFIKKIGIYMYEFFKIVKCVIFKIIYYKYWLWYDLFVKIWEYNRLYLNYGVEFILLCI